MAVQYTVGQRQYLIDVVITAVAADDAAASAVDAHRAFAFLECQRLPVGVALGRGAAIVPTDLQAFVDPEAEEAGHAAGALDFGYPLAAALPIPWQQASRTPHTYSAQPRPDSRGKR